MAKPVAGRRSDIDERSSLGRILSGAAPERECPMSDTVSIRAAQALSSRLISRVAAGERIVIARDD